MVTALKEELTADPALIQAVLAECEIDVRDPWVWRLSDILAELTAHLATGVNKGDREETVYLGQVAKGINIAVAGMNKLIEHDRNENAWHQAVLRGLVVAQHAVHQLARANGQVGTKGRNGHNGAQ